MVLILIGLEINEVNGSGMPMIQAVAVGLHERNINIFFVRQRVDLTNGTIIEDNKESISFLSYMVQVWNQLQDLFFAGDDE